MPIPADIKLRAPTTASTSTPSTFDPPSMEWIQGKWHVTHSTLPMWKKVSNVTITYSPLSSDPSKLDDYVSYISTSLFGPSAKSIKGIDTPAGPGCWNWRGSGWLMIASSHWEILGYGDEEGSEGGRWVVTYFAKTLFTPAGIDIYSWNQGGLKAETLERIKKALVEVEDEVVRRLAAEVFEVKQEASGKALQDAGFI